MSKSYAPFVAVAMLAAGVFGVACGADPARPAPLDVTTVEHCWREAGPTWGGPLPCVWDGATQYNGQYSGPRWLLYVEECPVVTVQPASEVECIGRADWSGQ